MSDFLLKTVKVRILSLPLESVRQAIISPSAVFRFA